MNTSITTTALNAAVVPTNLLEANKKHVLEIFLATSALNNYWLTEAQRNVVEAVALQNGAEGGEGVYWARGMLHMPVRETAYSILRNSSNSSNTSSLENNTQINYPMKDVALVKADLKLSEISVYDISGSLLLKNMVSSYTTVVHIKSFAKGMYIARIKFENGTSVSKKIFKQ